MKIGYPCINYSLKCSPNKKFRLNSYSKERLRDSINNNLDCLLNILQFNKENNLNFFRISSDTIPFASHPVMSINWRSEYNKKLTEIGEFIRKNQFRISMHPDQFILINSLREDVLQRSIKELLYHAEFLDSLELDLTAKIQIHIGGVYDDKKRSIERFLKRYELLPEFIKRRLVIENDDKFYNILDCLYINKNSGIPVIFDYFHYKCNNNGEKLNDFLNKVDNTWKEEDGILMVDYSSQEENSKTGTHSRKIDLEDFKDFIIKTRPYDFDIMLEIKDKEKSAIKAVNLIKKINLI